jgi:hypothetical protein
MCGSLVTGRCRRRRRDSSCCRSRRRTGQPPREHTYHLRKPSVACRLRLGTVLDHRLLRPTHTRTTKQRTRMQVWTSSSGRIVLIREFRSTTKSQYVWRVQLGIGAVRVMQQGALDRGVMRRSLARPRFKNRTGHF